MAASWQIWRSLFHPYLQAYHVVSLPTESSRPIRTKCHLVTKIQNIIPHIRLRRTWLKLLYSRWVRLSSATWLSCCVICIHGYFLRKNRYYGTRTGDHGLLNVSRLLWISQRKGGENYRTLFLLRRPTTSFLLHSKLVYWLNLSTIEDSEETGQLT
jgi:hypothetical protein